MIRVIVHYPNYFDENNILQDGTQVIDTNNDEELRQILKDIYDLKKVDHVHLEFGFYNESHDFVHKGEVVIPFKDNVIPYISL